MQTDLMLDALEQALWARGKPKSVTHHSGRGSQYLFIRYIDRLAEAGFNASVGSVVIGTITRWQKPTMVFTRHGPFTKMVPGVGLRM